jgi:hypothetical protein
MEKYQPTAEFQDLLAILADSALSDEQEQRLEHILRTDVRARKHYMNYISLLTSLHWKYAETAALASKYSETSKLSEPVSGVKPIRWRGWKLTSYGIVAALAVVLTLAYRMASNDAHPTTVALEAVATLSHVENVRWPAGSVALIAGSRVFPGHIQLETGQLQLHFTNGASLAVTGPADLDIESAFSVMLNSGRVRVHCPKTAVGFSLKTTASRFVDLGTEFGVAVNDDQSSEVHVFDGLVLARPTGSDLVVPIMREEAARVDVERGGTSSIAANVALFPILAEGEMSEHPAASLPPQAPLPVGARLVFMGRWETDRGVHLHMMGEALAQLPKEQRPFLFNMGFTVPLFFQDSQLDHFVVPLKPTHAIIEFGPQINSKGVMYDPPQDFEPAYNRLLDALIQRGIQPILRTSFRVCDKEPARRDYCNAYNKIIREQANKRGLRLIDVAARFAELPDQGESLLLENHSEPNFEGSRELARIELAALGFPTLEIPQQLQFKPLPGIRRDWTYCIRSTDAPLSVEEATHIHPDSTWKTLRLPQADDKLDKRSVEKWRSYIYRGKAQGYAFVTNQVRNKSVEAVNYLDSDRERDVFINTGGSLYAVWLNGEKVYEDRAPRRGWHSGRDRIPAHARAGRNTIIVETQDDFFLSVTDDCDWPIQGE